MNFSTQDTANQTLTLNDQVSIVMVTRNRGKQIQTALEHLLQLPERPRIIVIDNNSSDATVEIAHDMGTAVQVIPLQKNIGGAGRNVGVLRTDTPYVAFSDDDSWWAPGALKRAVELFESNPTLGLIAAKILVGPNERLAPLCQAMATSPLARRVAGSVGVPIVGFAACGTIVRRRAFLEAGGFEQRFGVGGEEQVLALDLLRRGWQLAYIGDIVAYHYPSQIRDLAKRKRMEIRNALWSAWLRRSAITALAETWFLAKQASKNRDSRAGFVEAILGLPWVISARDPVPAEIDDQVKMAEEHFRDFGIHH